MAKVIATDLDGTLLFPRYRIRLVDPRYKKMIKDNALKVILVSGRGSSFCKKINRLLKLGHDYICYNGALIVNNDNIIFKKLLDKGSIINLYNELLETFSKISFYIFDEFDRIYLGGNNSLISRYIKYWRRRIKYLFLSEKIIVSDKKLKKSLSSNTNFFKAIIGDHQFKEDIAIILQQKYGSFFDFFITKKSIEISPKGVNKGLSLLKLTEASNITKEDIIVVGDDLNDLSMFELFDNSFAMSNGSSQLKMKAKHIIDDFSQLKNYL